MEQIIIPARLANLHLFAPETQGFNKEKHGATVVIEKKEVDTLGKVNTAIDTEIKNMWGDAPPERLKRPLKDGKPWGVGADLQNVCHLDAYGKLRPKVFDRNVNPIQQDREFADGCRCNVILTFKAYEVEGNAGVTCYLDAVQVVKDDPWKKKFSVTDFFDVIPDED